MSAQAARPDQDLSYQQDEQATNLLKQAGELRRRSTSCMQQYGAAAQDLQRHHARNHKAHERNRDDHRDVRDNIANFDDFFRPIRSYFYWEKHCYDIPACWALRSVFDALDGIDQLTEKFENLTRESGQAGHAPAETGGADTAPDRQPGDNRDHDVRTMPPNRYQRAGEGAVDNATAHGRAFDAAKNDDTFYLPPEAFDNPDFKRGLKLFLSPDGKAVPHDHHP